MRVYMVEIKAFGHVSIQRVMATNKTAAIDKRLDQLGVVITAKPATRK
jgi:hypothetical protein